MATRPTIFKWRQTEPVLILSAVRWYLRYSLSLRDVEELLKERGLEVDHTTVWHWVQRYGPELEERLRRHLKRPGGLDQISRLERPRWGSGKAVYEGPVVDHGDHLLGDQHRHVIGVGLLRTPASDAAASQSERPHRVRGVQPTL